MVIYYNCKLIINCVFLIYKIEGKYMPKNNTAASLGGSANDEIENLDNDDNLSIISETPKEVAAREKAEQERKITELTVSQGSFKTEQDSLKAEIAALRSSLQASENIRQKEAAEAQSKQQQSEATITALNQQSTLWIQKITELAAVFTQLRNEITAYKQTSHAEIGQSRARAELALVAAEVARTQATQRSQQLETTLRAELRQVHEQCTSAHSNILNELRNHNHAFRSYHGHYLGTGIAKLAPPGTGLTPY
jgi:hypothetical protein